MSSTTTCDQGCDTPTHSSVHDGSADYVTSIDLILNRSRNCPWEGRTFIIREPTTKFMIGLHKGILCLVPEQSGHGCGVYWACLESKDMWLGFENVVSSTFLGHDNNGKVIAQAKKQSDFEYFFVRAHPNGGYVLLMKNGWGFLPLQVERDRQLVIGSKKDGGRAWEFIRVEHAR